jgi:hypothetical protein
MEICLYSIYYWFSKKLHQIFQTQQIESMTISMRIKKQIMKLLRELFILLTNINKKPLTQFNQSISNNSIELQKKFLILINQHSQDFK